MKFRWLLVALLSLALAVAAGCSGDSNGPFVGSWISAAGHRITFPDNSTWYDSDGDSGSYSFTGEDPVFTLNLDTATLRYLRRATFIDSMTLELCVQSSSGSIGACTTLVIDRPTLH